MLRQLWAVGVCSAVSPVVPDQSVNTGELSRDAQDWGSKAAGGLMASHPGHPLAMNLGARHGDLEARFPTFDLRADK